MINLSSFGDTAALQLSDTPATWTNTGPRTAIVALATVNALLALGREPVATDFLLLAGQYVRLRVDADAVVGFVAADAGATGEIRLTPAGDY